jgi:hypothetical protein
MKKHLRTPLLTSILGASFALPLLALAQNSAARGIQLSSIEPYSTGLINLINNILVPVLMAIAFIVFIWGIYKYFIYGAAEEKSQTEGRQLVLWGLIGFVIILSLWGIVNLFMGTLGLSAGTVPRYPTIGNGTGASNTTGSLNVTGGSAIGGNTGPGTVSAAQQSDAAALDQKRTVMQDTCAQYGASSPGCIATTADYNRALTDYNYDYPTSGNTSSAGTQPSGGLCTGSCQANPCGADQDPSAGSCPSASAEFCCVAVSSGNTVTCSDGVTVVSDENLCPAPAAQQYTCPDGVTTVSDLNLCPS